jgi:hypothetical protein
MFLHGFSMRGTGFLTHWEIAKMKVLAANINPRSPGAAHDPRGKAGALAGAAAVRAVMAQPLLGTSKCPSWLPSFRLQV